MFIAATAAELPHDDGGCVKDHRKNAIVKLLAKFKEQKALDAGDLKALTWALKTTKKRIFVPFYKALCFSKVLCKKDRALLA